MKGSISTALVAALALGTGWLGAPVFLRPKSGPDLPEAGGFSRPALSALASPTAGGIRGGSPSERMFRALEAAEGEGKGDFARQLAELEALGLDGEVAKAMREGLFRSWIAVDAAAAFQWALSRENEEETKEMVALWAAVDGERALEAIGGVESVNLRARLQMVCATAMVAHDRERAVEILQENKLLNQAPDAFFAALAGQDRGFALEVVAGMKDDNSQARAFAAIYREWASEAPREAFAALSGESRIKDPHGTVWAAVAQEWFEKDPAGAAAFFAESEDKAWTGKCLEAVMSGWGKIDFEGALAFAQGLEGKARGDAIGKLAESQVEAQGAVAFRAVCEEGMGWQCQNVASRWASKDWEGALTAILALEAGTTREAALRGFTRGLGNNPIVGSAGIGKWVGPFMEMAPAQGGAVLDLGWAVPSLSIGEIEGYAAQYGSRFTTAIESGVESMAQTDPVAASRIVDALPESGGRAELTQAVTAKWALEDGPSAAAWAAALGEGKARDVAFQNVANAWTRHDPEQARTWIGSLPDSPARDAALGEYVGMVSSGGGSELVELARSIGNEQQRDTAMTAALRAWVGREGEAAVEAIGAMDLPKGVRERVTEFAESERWWRELGK